ncbi:hypothetical protein [Thalassorhabdomicrobium marinisediminis]|uniref:DUF296 domain-containing protein n=1 Tax=Thalassorhabdomicrobium marinisediminis TaxID=2170577 RepID=A0A2T7FTK2_9RHOB|nr:hypothetical protein [Thalassorhabdomicrobium marinisediminis]PVA05495.1 hypothetical protein DC363_14715 [Thalassorhabdomicrobium marinisediminis]
MSEPHVLRHPGPATAPRIAAVPCRADKRRVTLRAGRPLLQAMAEVAGEAGAWFDLRDLRLRRLAFVRPAPSPDGKHVAWYSATTVLQDAMIDYAGAHLGLRDGEAFAHVHGLWTDAQGVAHAGHLLAEQSELAFDQPVDLWLLEGARYESAPDTETGFTLFRPVATQPVEQPNALLTSVRPNVLLEDALADCAARIGSAAPRVRGLGSLVGADLGPGATIDDIASEVVLTGDAGAAAIAVGFDGPPVAGPPTPGRNRVCVTFELLLLG